MPHPVFRSSATALITGGASGIGLAVAKLCTKHGMNVALVDINAANLSSAKASIGDNSKVETYVVDVSKIEEWKKLKGDVETKFKAVDFLMLNAGVGGSSTWEDTAYFHKILDTNLFGVIHGLSTFLPVVRAQSSPTAIVITGSKQGITNPPGNPAYNASKAAVRSLAESLSFDLRDTSTSAHLLVPGWTHTGLTGGGGVKVKPDGAWAPEQVAGFLEQKMADGKFYVICPDNDVTEEMDQRRMLWGTGDVVYGRPPLTRWRPEWKEKAEEGMKGLKL